MQRRTKCIGACLGLLLLCHAMIAPPVRAITIQEEEEIAQEFMDKARQAFQFIRDPMIVEYVNDVGVRILKTMPPQPFKFRFYVVRQNVYNAFAAPAAHIFVNSGLIAAMESESELAGILGHEIVHAMARHISQNIDRSAKMNLALLGGLLAGVLLGMAGGSELGQAVTTSAMAAGQTAALAYSRQDEMQADELGIQYLTEAGYSGKGLLTMLKKIRDTQLYVASDVPTYLMTHPAVDDRIAYLDAWMASHPGQQDRGGTPESRERFRRIRTRLISGYGEKTTALREMSEAIKAHPEDPVVQHGYGIALARNDAPDKGAEYVRRALEKLPFDGVMLKDLGEINFMAGHYPDALAALRSSIAISPRDHETHYLLGRTLIELEQYPEAVRALKKVLTMVPEDRSAIWYLGEAYGKTGEMGNAHYYLGLHAFERKDLANARFHLQKAARLLTDPSLTAEAEKRLAEMKKWPAPEEAKASR